MLWTVIFGAVILALLAGVVFVIVKLSRLEPLNKLANGKRLPRFLISVGILAALCAVLTLLLDAINMIICILYLAAFWLIADFILWIVKKIRKKPAKRVVSVGLALAATAVYLSAGWYLDHNVWRTDYTISTEKSVGEIRVLQVADSHVGTTFDGEGFLEYAEEMVECEPDVVLVTGDFVDDGTSYEDMVLSCKALGELGKASKYGVYFAFGNHDKGYYLADERGFDTDDLVSELEGNGVTVLEDEAVLIDDRFYIVGRKDYSEYQRGGSRAELSELTEQLDEDKYIIVMDHQPIDYDAESKTAADLVLSGHTHGGQLIPINLVGAFVNDRNYGTEQRNGTDFIVTSGISDWAIKFKTGCRSEYVVIDISGD